MTTVAFLNINGTTLSSTEDKVAAFVDGELRGSTNLIYVSSTDRYLAYLVIFSNSTNETINFKIYNSITDEIIDVPKILNFAINQHYGNVFQGFSLANPTLNSASEIISLNITDNTTNVNFDLNKVIIESNIFIAENINDLLVNFNLSQGAKLYDGHTLLGNENIPLNLSSKKKLNVLSEDQSNFEEWTIEIIDVDNDGDGVFSNKDCDDSEPLAYPGNTEVLNDGIDNDCDSNTLDDGSLKNKVEEKKYFRIFPNPTNGIIQLESLDVFTENIDCKIFDVSGRVIKRIENIDTDFIIDISTFKKGIYFIQVFNKTNKQTKRLIKI
jgi:hypothetical protein